jgi:hypothetical protein
LEHPDFDPSETNSCSDLMRMVILSIFVGKNAERICTSYSWQLIMRLFQTKKKESRTGFYLLSLSFNGFEYVED